MTGQAVDPAVANFMALFAELKEFVDDLPQDLPVLAGEDSSVLDLCRRLTSAADVLRDAERASSRAFSTHANPSFMKSWRDFEKRYEESLFKACLGRLEVGGEGLAVPDSFLTQELRWDAADLQGMIHSLSLSRLMLAVKAYGEEFTARLEQFLPLDKLEFSATEAWNDLVEKVGFDPHMAVRRRVLLPFTLVSKRISNREGTSKTIGLFQSLEDAHKAFVFGATNAAFGSMRSVLEALLRDHYGAEGRDLEEMLKTAKSRGLLPTGPERDAIYRLKLTANLLLHVGPKYEGDHFAYERLQKMNEKELEMEFVTLFLALRGLLERLQ